MQVTLLVAACVKLCCSTSLFAEVQTQGQHQGLDTCHLWSVRHVVGDEFAPDHCYGHEVRVWEVFVLVYGERDLAWTGQEAVANTARQAHSIAVLGRQKPQVSRVGLAPVRALHVVTVTREGTVLARLTGEVHLQRTAVAQRGISHVHHRQTVAHLVTGELEPGGKLRAQLAA